MTPRRAGRVSHVRPRPPSNGRPGPVKSRSPAPGRLSGHRPIDRGGRLPIPIRLLLIAVAVTLCAGVLYLGSGGLAVVAKGLGSTFAGIAARVTATPVPSPSELALMSAPTIEQPSEPYTNSATVDLVVTVPKALVGSDDHSIRLYLALKDQQPTPVQDAPIGSTQRTIIPTELTKGINDFSATLVGPEGESEPSPTVRLVLDASPPKITISSPKANAVVNRKAVKIDGKTQGRSTLIARNDANGASIGVSAGSDGSFSLNLPIASGQNAITITATDPAGNTSEAAITVRRGSGKLEVSLGTSVYTLKRSKLPTEMRLTATATDPDGNPLAGAAITFTLSIPGIPTVTMDQTSDKDGRAAWKTTVPKGATLGQGIATVLVSATEFGNATDRTAITVTK